MQKYSSGDNSLLHFHLKEKMKMKQSSRSCCLWGFQGGKVWCCKAHTLGRTAPFRHFVGSRGSGGQALLFSEESWSTALSPFPLAQGPTRAPLTSLGTELEQGWAKPFPSNRRRKGVYGNAWVLVGISSLPGSHRAVKSIIFNELGQSWLCYFVTY